MYVWRADREGGDTKTRKSRRTLELPKLAAQALRQHHTRQAVLKLKAGEAWQDHQTRGTRNRLESPRTTSLVRLHHE